MSSMSGGASARRPSEREFGFIHVDNLRPLPLNEQLYGSPELDENFVESIAATGVLEPIITAWMSFNGGESFDRYIVSGHRRWLAAKQVGIKQIPARDYTAFGSYRKQIRTAGN